MLVLTRREKQSVVIECDGKRIEVVIQSISGRSVSVGIKAPKDVRITRGELNEKRDSH